MIISNDKKTWTHTHVHHFLDHTAERFPDQVAVVHNSYRVTYRELARKAGILAGTLAAHTKVQDRVVLMWENSPEYIIAYYAILKSGCTVVSLSTDLKPDSLSGLIEEIEPAAIIASARQGKIAAPVLAKAGSLCAVIVEGGKQVMPDASCQVFDYQTIVSHDPPAESTGRAVEKDALAAIIYTSGSTGKPKGVMLTHHNIVENTRSICEYLDLSGIDIQMVVLPFFYVMGKSLLNTHFAVGGRVVINNQFAFPASVLKQMVDEGVTGFSGVPSTYTFLLNRSPLESYRDKLTKLRYCTQAGGHMAKQVKLDLRKKLPDHTAIIVMYGATEASARLTYLDPSRFFDKIESIGREIPRVTIRVLDVNDKELPPGETGEIVAAGENIMRGYWRDEAATARALDSHGYHTGDLGYKDQEGFIFVTGRKDAVLKVGGHRINPQEVEDTLMETSLLVEAAVFGVPDRLLGHRLAAICVPKNSTIKKEEIMRQIAGKLPRYKLVEQLVFASALPKNANGKLDRFQCLKMIEAR